MDGWTCWRVQARQLFGPQRYEGCDADERRLGRRFWTGGSVITIEDGVPGGRPLSLDLTTGHWSLGPKAPVPGRQEAHELWTGSEVLVWGGGTPVGFGCCTTVKPGYSYTP